MIKNIILSLVFGMMAMIMAALIGKYYNPDNEILEHIESNRVLIFTFFTMWMYQTTRRKG